MANKKQNSKAKYKAIADVSVYFSDITLTGISEENAKKLIEGEALEEKDLGSQFNYMLKNNIISEES